MATLGHRQRRDASQQTTHDVRLRVRVIVESAFEQLEQHEPHRIQVACPGKNACSDQFGRAVQGGDVQCRGAPVLADAACATQVSYPGEEFVTGQQNVGALDVTVQDAVHLMEVSQPA